MAFRLDHIVIGVHDLAAAAADFTQAGFQVTPGGEHSSGNTHNALVTFADGAYLELIAFKDHQIDPTHKWGARLAAGEMLGGQPEPLLEPFRPDRLIV